MSWKQDASDTEKVLFQQWQKTQSQHNQTAALPLFFSAWHVFFWISVRLKHAEKCRLSMEYRVQFSSLEQILARLEQTFTVHVQSWSRSKQTQYRLKSCPLQSTLHASASCTSSKMISPALLRSAHVLIFWPISIQRLEYVSFISPQRVLRRWMPKGCFLLESRWLRAFGAGQVTELTARQSYHPRLELFPEIGKSQPSSTA